jgi:hypothetical protein
MTGKFKLLWEGDSNPYRSVARSTAETVRKSIHYSDCGSSLSIVSERFGPCKVYYVVNAL